MSKRIDEIMDEMDLPSARRAIAALEKEMDKLSFTPPELVDMRRELFSEHMNHLAAALCLYRKKGSVKDE